MLADGSKLVFLVDPDGGLNLGHYHGVLQQLKQLQYEYQTIVVITDLRYLNSLPNKATEYSANIEKIVIDCLISGIDPSQTIICIQSQVPELGELKQIMSAITPLGWLEREQNYKDFLEEIDNRPELNTYGLLGIPLIYSNILLGFNATFALETDDKVSYVELSREIGRRFNYIYGREDGFEEKAQESINKLGEKKAELYLQLLTKFQQDGNEDAAERARYMLEDSNNLPFGDKERLLAFLENKSKVYFNETQCLPQQEKITGTDGSIMRNRAQNAIEMRTRAEIIEEKIRMMTTDPARVKRTDPGNPEKCPVWKLHYEYTPEETKQLLELGCLSATIGCLECKQKLSSNIISEQEEMLKRAMPYMEDQMLIRRILNDGNNKASKLVNETLTMVKDAIRINY